MNNDPGIICFRHCSTSNVFCKDIPETCPACSADIDDFLVEPFRVPYPLVNAAHHPISVAIRPARGNFLDHYDGTQDLHVGIVGSTSDIVEYDRNGLIRNDRASWADCVAFSVISVDWAVRWDETLAFMLRDPKWRSVNYDENTANCFDFALEFLNGLGHPDLRFASKEDLCDRLILSRIRDVIRYSSLYKTLKDQRYLLSDKTF